jgi:hypothetical protein
MSRIVIVTRILTYHFHKLIDSINLMARSGGVMYFLWGMEKCLDLSFKRKTKRWIMSRIVIVILTYHRHKPIDSINLLDS